MMVMMRMIMTMMIMKTIREVLKSECTEKSSKIGKSWPQLKT